MSTRAAPQVKLHTVREVAVMLGISESQVWHLTRAGELDSLKIGWSRRILATAVDQYIKRRLAAEKAS